MKIGDLVRDRHREDIGVIIEIDGNPEQHRVYRVCFATETVWLLATYLKVVS